MEKKPEKRYPFSPFPDGWFAACMSDELAVGQVLAKTLFGKAVVLFRTESGRACVLDAYCPHMGAHLGYGGTVEGETVRCPMHAFRFDKDGACVATGYGTPASKKCTVGAWEVREFNGCVFVFHDHRGRASTWSPPAQDMTGWTPIRLSVIRELRSHPQETTENSVDFGHLGPVHGYQNLDTVEPVSTDGPYLTTRYRMTRRAVMPGTPPIETAFHIQVWGLGYSFVETEVFSLGLRTRHFIYATPIDGEHIELRLGTSFRAVEGRLFSRVPLALLHHALGPKLASEFIGDVRQDFDIWSNKQYIDPPLLAHGDGPVGKYRRWARQFYPSASLTPAEAAE